MDAQPALFARLGAALAPAGLMVRGGFHPDAADDVPPRTDGRPAETVLLIGNAGAAMWEAFARTEATWAARHPLDSFLRPPIEAAARLAGATALFPNEGPPFVPIQRWAARAESVHRSPLGILIHPEFGLWHAYRGVLLLAERMALPARDDRPSPCASCARRPCLRVCPVGAFTDPGFEAEACVGHVTSREGHVCAEKGCLARRACPIGRAHAYPAVAQRFHMAAFVRAVRRGFIGSSAAEKRRSDP